MTRAKVESLRVASRDRHVSRSGPWNAKPMKKAGGGKWNWGVDGVEVDDFIVPVNQVFEDAEFRDIEAESVVQQVSKITVISSDDLDYSSSEE